MNFQKVQSDYSCYDPLIVINDQKLRFVGDDNPPMFKYLGMWIQSDLKEDIVVEKVEDTLVGWLKTIDSAPLDGRMKVWIVNFHVCSKLAWLLMVQNWSETTAAGWQKHIHRKFRKWLGLAKSAEPSILYRRKEHFGLQLKDLQQQQNQLRVVKWHILKNSKDLDCQKLYRYRLDCDQKGQIGQGRNTSSCLRLEDLERSKSLDALSAIGQSDRKGLGFQSQVKEAENPRQDMIRRLKEETEAKRLLVLHRYEMQASWLSWGLDKLMQRDLSWTTILHQYSDRLLKFVLNAQQNTLPSPDNLRRWNLKKDAICGLCKDREVTLSHILAGCHWVRNVEHKLPQEDRFTWRHNNLLFHLAKVVVDHMKVVNASRPAKQRQAADSLIRFIRPGQPARKSYRKAKPPSLLDVASDWSVDFDLSEFRRPGSAYVFPHVVCQTSLRIDGYLLSRTARTCIGLELTCPMEENITKWHGSKLRKYEEEISFQATKNGWKFYAVVIEVGARGWIPPSVHSGLSRLGIPRHLVKSLCKQLTLLAIKSSYIIWLNRFNQDFQPWRLITH